MKRLVLAEAAQEDLRAIARYTARQWGEAQAKIYMETMRARLGQLRDNPGIGAPRDEIRPGYRSILSGRHVLFYRETLQAVEVIRVLHERMDMHRQLAAEEKS